MSTLVLVTPANRLDGREDRFTPGHLRELAGRFDRVVMVLDGPENGKVLDVSSVSSGAVVRTDAALESVLDALAASDTQCGAAVIIDGDLRAVHRAGTAAKQRSVPVLWWCDGPPANDIQRDVIAFVDAVVAPLEQSTEGRHLAIGAGIDTRALRVLPFPPQPPMHILILGRAVDQGGLAIPLRALAEARAQGADAHLLIVDSMRVSTAGARRIAESLVADLMLTKSVELLDANRPVALPEILHRVHAVIDAGADTEIDHLILETMACGRPVLSARPALTPLLVEESLPLVFATGDPSSLAACITALADARQDELVEVGTRLRSKIEQHHSLSRWGASIAAIVDTLHPS